MLKLFEEAGLLPNVAEGGFYTAASPEKIKLPGSSSLERMGVVAAQTLESGLDSLQMNSV